MNQLRLNYNKALYHEKEDIMVLWQAKSGCTMVKKMFFHHEGILDEILKKTTIGFTTSTIQNII